MVEPSHQVSTNPRDRILREEGHLSRSLVKSVFPELLCLSGYRGRILLPSLNAAA